MYHGNNFNKKLKNIVIRSLIYARLLYITKFKVANFLCTRFIYASKTKFLLPSLITTDTKSLVIFLSYIKHIVKTISDM